MFTFYDPETEYGLMVMNECVTTTPDILMATRLTGFDVMGNIEQSESLYEAELTHIATMTAWLETEASDFQKTLCGYNQMLSSAGQFHELKKCVVNDVLSSLRIVNGYDCSLEKTLRKLNPLRKNEDQLKTLFSNHKDINNKSIDYLFSPESHSKSYQMIETMKRGIYRMNRFIPLMTKKEFAMELQKQIQISLSKTNITPHLRESLFDSPRIRKRNLSDKQMTQAKKIIQRGVKLYESLFNKKDISAFMKGNEVTIEGHYYNYKAQMAPSFDIYKLSLKGANYTPFLLTVHRKDDTYLGRACVYFEDTPVVDNLIGITLMVSNMENELEFLRTMNLFQCSPQYAREETLQDIRKDRFIDQDLILGPNLDDNTSNPTSEKSALKSIMSYHLDGNTPEEWIEFENTIRTDIEHKVESQLHTGLGLNRNIYEYMLCPTTSMDKLITIAKDHTLAIESKDKKKLNLPDLSM